MGVLQRIKQFLDYKDVRVSLFEKKVGISNGAFASQLKNNKTIGVDKLEKILNEYPEINPTWLLTGKGEMLTTTNFEEIKTNSGKVNNNYILNFQESDINNQANISCIKNRLIELARCKNFNLNNFCNNHGFITEKEFTDDFKKRSLSMEDLHEIASLLSTFIPDVNKEWLLEGKGEMLKNKHRSYYVKHENDSPMDDGNQETESAISDYIPKKIDHLKDMYIKVLEVSRENAIHDAESFKDIKTELLDKLKEQDQIIKTLRTENIDLKKELQNLKKIKNIYLSSK